MKRSLRNLSIAIVLMVMIAALAGCGMKRDVVVINSDETAFNIPLTGDSNNQAQLYSEANLNENKVVAKRAYVNYERVRTRSTQILGTWYPQNQIVKVSLRPVTRAWTANPSTGTDPADQALVAETKESIRFSAEFNCNAQVEEGAAAKFVHNYYGKQLEEVIDKQVRPYAQQLFTEKSAEYTMDEFLANKSVITKYVRDGVTNKFADQGIRILTLGMQGDISWDPKIQDSIDARIRANNEYLAAKSKNNQKVEAAQAANKEAQLLSGATAMKIRQLEIAKIKAEAERAAVDKWDGALPTSMIPGSALPFLNVK